MAEQPKTCDTCKFWHPFAVDPINLGAEKRGECREGPPHATSIPQQGRLAVVASYPNLPAGFPACGRHALEVVTS